MFAPLTGTSTVLNPCDVPGPFGRVYTESTLARERQQSTAGVKQPITVGADSAPGASASASMGVLLPSPLTTAPYTRISIDEPSQSSASRLHDPPSSPPAPAKVTHHHHSASLTHNEVYHRPPTSGSVGPTHARRHTHSGVISSHELAMMPPSHPPPASTPSPTSATSTSSVSSSSPFAQTVNYDYAPTTRSSGSLSPVETYQHHPSAAYHTPVSYYQQDPRSYQHFQSQQYGAPVSHYHQAPFVHISVPVQGDLVNGRGYMQWRV